jgi:hypothetical protein
VKPGQRTQPVLCYLTTHAHQTLQEQCGYPARIVRCHFALETLDNTAFVRYYELVLYGYLLEVFVAMGCTRLRQS